MRVSSLKDLIYAKELKSANVSFIDEFCVQGAKEPKALAFAYFAKDMQGVKEALEKSAYAVIVDFEVGEIDDEIWCFYVDDISLALKRLVEYMAKDKHFYLANKIEESFAKKLGLNVLMGDIFKDFDAIVKNDKNTIFLSSNEKYLSEISSFKKLPRYDYEIIHSSNFLHTSFKIKNIDLFYSDLFGTIHDVYFSDMIIPSELVGEFCGVYYLAKKSAYMVDFYYIDEFGMICDNFSTDKCVIIVGDEYAQMKEHFKANTNVYFAKNYDDMLSQKSGFVFLQINKDEFLQKSQKEKKHFFLKEIL